MVVEAGGQVFRHSDGCRDGNRASDAGPHQPIKNNDGFVLRRPHRADLLARGIDEPAAHAACAGLGRHGLRLSQRRAARSPRSRSMPFATGWKWCSSRCRACLPMRTAMPARRLLGDGGVLAGAGLEGDRAVSVRRDETREHRPGGRLSGRGRRNAVADAASDPGECRSTGRNAVSSIPRSCR